MHYLLIKNLPPSFKQLERSKSGKTKSDTYQKRKAIFGAKTKSDENNKGDTRNSIAFIIFVDDGLHVQIKLYILFPCQ